jgi:hypothetical protein
MEVDQDDEDMKNEIGPGCYALDIGFEDIGCSSGYAKITYGYT